MCGASIPSGVLRCPECNSFRTKKLQAVATVLFVATIICFAWWLLFFGSWFVPTEQVMYWSCVPALLIAAALGFRSWGPSKPKLRALWNASGMGRDTLVLRLGRVAFLAGMFWLMFAEAAPATFTKAFGGSKTRTYHIDAYFPSTWSCGYKIRLREFNPPAINGYCRFNGKDTDFQDGAVVRVVSKETALGVLVEDIHNL
jgi:hypothetical protein